MTVSAVGLTKYFGGKRALGPVSFEVAEGQTIGFLGLNGAGKSTLLRILAGDLRPSSGELRVHGVDAIRNPFEVRRLVGFLPELPPVYPDMPVGEYLRFAGRLRGLDAARVEQRLEEVEALTQLAGVRGEQVRNLSQGYRQRVGLAQAIIHEPRLLILDEPTHDLDPAQIVEMRSLLVALKNRHTIFLSSHNLPEISETCDRLFVVDGGEIIATGSEAELSARILDVQGVEVTVRFGDSHPAEDELGFVLARVRGVESVRDVRLLEHVGRDTTFVVEATEDCRAAICRTLVEGGHEVIGLTRSHRKLENVFLNLVRGGVGERDIGHPAA